MLTSKIPVIAIDYETPSEYTGRRGERQEIDWPLLTGCVYIIIVSTENKPFSTTTKLLVLYVGYVD